MGTATESTLSQHKGRCQVTISREASSEWVNFSGVAARLGEDEFRGGELLGGRLLADAVLAARGGTPHRPTAGRLVLVLVGALLVVLLDRPGRVVEPVGVLHLEAHEIGRAHVWTPVTKAHLVCRIR